MSETNNTLDHQLVGFMATGRGGDTTLEAWNKIFQDREPVAIDGRGGALRNVDVTGRLLMAGEGGRFVGLPTRYRLVPKEKIRGNEAREFYPPAFREALFDRYGLSEGMATVVAFHGLSSDSSAPREIPEVVLILKKDAARALAMQALQILSDTERAAAVLQVDRKYFERELNNPDSNMSALVANIVRNGGFVRNDPMLTDLEDEAIRKHNSALATRLHDLKLAAPDGRFMEKLKEKKKRKDNGREAG